MHKTEHRLAIALARYSLIKNFKNVEINIEKEPIFYLKVKFSNGAKWICIPTDNDYSIYKPTDNAEIVYMRSLLINTDIGKSTYEVSFIKQNGEVIFKSIETISPLKILSTL